MFLRSKIQEMILRRRSRSMNSAGAQRGHVPDQAPSSSTVPCDDDSAGAGAGGSRSAGARALFASPRMLHSSSLPAGAGAGVVAFARSPAAEPEPETASSLSPTSVLDAAAAYVPRTGKRRRPWRARDNNGGLADVLDCTDDQQQERIVLAATSSSRSLLRSCSLDRRVEFGVKNKSSWLPLRGRGEPAAPAPADPREIGPSSEDYTCVISRGPNPRTVHIFGDRVVEAEAETETESSPRPISLPTRTDPRPRTRSLMSDDAA
ncbi:uncharacterized protein [Zea mays]|jgi:hypothetical protein|uniref:Uncharacterized protein n=1 Tax=Zea mays TaxID=4577 RepID=A0A096PZ18_MAIZE|nr:uncharacterized protein LOC100275496 [Zea mays]XP_008681613.1 uncharacterized protein LOC100275496 isoform X1 [Zea mays]AQK63027.1 hypothetical protein ZEAMMB73_Zm00001d013287 [Zea mays]|eukprot:XP_008681613.1 uncharacterized protein LOC100275496 isoform X1 [Zea mays]